MFGSRAELEAAARSGTGRVLCWGRVDDDRAGYRQWDVDGFRIGRDRGRTTLRLQPGRLVVGTSEAEDCAGMRSDIRAAIDLGAGFAMDDVYSLFAQYTWGVCVAVELFLANDV